MYDQEPKKDCGSNDCHRGTAENASNKAKRSMSKKAQNPAISKVSQTSGEKLKGVKPSIEVNFSARHLKRLIAKCATSQGDMSNKDLIALMTHAREVLRARAQNEANEAEAKRVNADSLELKKFHNKMLEFNNDDFCTFDDGCEGEWAIRIKNFELKKTLLHIAVLMQEFTYYLNKPSLLMGKGAANRKARVSRAYHAIQGSRIGDDSRANASSFVRAVRREATKTHSKDSDVQDALKPASRRIVMHASRLFEMNVNSETLQSNNDLIEFIGDLLKRYSLEKRRGKFTAYAISARVLLKLHKSYGLKTSLIPVSKLKTESDQKEVIEELTNELAKTSKRLGFTSV
jgi:hypothetical protein